MKGGYLIYSACIFIVLCIPLCQGAIFTRTCTHWTGVEDCHHSLTRIESNEEFINECNDTDAWHVKCPTTPLVNLDPPLTPASDLCEDSCRLSCNLCGSNAFLTAPSNHKESCGDCDVCAELHSKPPWACKRKELMDASTPSYIAMHIHPKDLIAIDGSYCDMGDTRDFCLSFNFRRRGKLNAGETATKTVVSACLIIDLPGDDSTDFKERCFDLTTPTVPTHNVIPTTSPPVVGTVYNDIASSDVYNFWMHSVLFIEDIPCNAEDAIEEAISVYLKIEKGVDHFDIDEVVFETGNNGLDVAPGDCVAGITRVDGGDLIKEQVEEYYRWDCC